MRIDPHFFGGIFLENDAMQVRVSYATQIRQKTGVASETVVVEESATIPELFQLLCQQQGGDLQAMLYDAEGGIRRSLMVIVNDQHVVEPAQHLLRPDDDVLIMTAISGG